MHKDFDTFMSQLRKTNLTLDIICDFRKIERHVEDIKLSLCMLNSLIGSTDLRKSVETIWRRDKSAFSVMSILVASRNTSNMQVVSPSGEEVALDSMFDSVDGVVEFLDHTGLGQMLTEGKVRNLVDYVFGVETGLDSNARKNRNGKAMETLIATILNRHRIPFRTQVGSSEWPLLQRELGEDKKVFDFVVAARDKTFLIEVNFYTAGGSKLNEVARSYSEIAPKVNAVPGFEFVWITDGCGWHAAKSKLLNAYDIIPRVYNLTTLTDFIDEVQCG